MNTKGLTAVVFLAVAAGLSGCYESADVTVYEQGMYKGKKDPLLSQQGAAREESLKKRFQLVQLDR
jgi:hypothetical protein